MEERRRKHFEHSVAVFPPNYTLRCEEKDHVTAHVLVGARMSKVTDFCGSEMPPRLMSARNILTLDYVVKSVNAKQSDEYGLEFEYRFLTDYGEQPPEAIKDLNRGGL